MIVIVATQLLTPLIFEMFDPLSTIEDLKLFHFASRSDAYESIQFYHGNLKPPKKLKMIRENIGSRVTYRCIDVDCPVRVSVKSVVKQRQVSWVIFDRQDHPEQWTHGPFCECVVSLSTKTSARILRDIDGNGRDLVLKARDRGINLGGSQSYNSDVSQVRGSGGLLVKKRVSFGKW